MIYGRTDVLNKRFNGLLFHGIHQREGLMKLRLITLLLTTLLSSYALAEMTKAKETRPNILLVVFDDVGFMGLGAYGSDAKTPNIDTIAEKGAQFSSFHTASMCGPSRAMLMTGQDSHHVGMSTLVEVLSPEMESHPSYSMEWKEDQKTLASWLKEVGYQTFVSGKWGIGRTGKNLPHKFGFDRSYVLDATGASNYREAPYMPLYKTVSWFEDGEPVSLPEDFYSSRDLVNKMISYVDEATPNKPFFGFLSLQAVHIPVQVPKEYTDKYNGVFDRGWDEMRKERLPRAIELGLVPETTKLAAVHESNREWDELNDEEKAYWARMMQVNAGMTEAADYHIGRLFKHLENKGMMNNTIVIVTSDNGAESNTVGMQTGAAKPIQVAAAKFWMKTENWDLDYENLGQPGSLAAIGPEWASVSAAPLNLYKFNSSEGGQRVPLMISGPGVADTGILSGRAHVSDLVPTLLQYANVQYSPDEFYGRSLHPMLTGEHQDVWGQDSYGFEASGNSALYKGKWKIVRVKKPYGDEQWHLYDLSLDPGETTNLVAQNTVTFQEMLNEYQSYSKQFGIIELKVGENFMGQLVINTVKKWPADNWPKLLGLVLLIAGVVYGIKRLRRRA